MEKIRVIDRSRAYADEAYSANEYDAYGSKHATRSIAGLKRAKKVYSCTCGRCYADSPDYCERAWRSEEPETTGFHPLCIIGKAYLAMSMVAFGFAICAYII